MSKESRMSDCPICGKDKPTFDCNIGKDNWRYCTKCRVTWWEGSNLFSSWQHETQEDWIANIRMLNPYMVVGGTLERCGGDRVARSNCFPNESLLHTPGLVLLERQLRAKDARTSDQAQDITEEIDLDGIPF